MRKPKVLLADDHIILVEALKKLLEPTCDVVGVAADGHSLISLAEKLRPEIIVADINMPHLNGLEACEKLSKRLPDTRIIFLTVSEDPDTAEEGIRRGASGYLLKKGAPAELFKAIQTVLTGRIYLSPSITREPVSVFVSRARSHEAQETLTSRQREVLQLLAEGSGGFPEHHTAHHRFPQILHDAAPGYYAKFGAGSVRDPDRLVPQPGSRRVRSA